MEDSRISELASVDQIKEKAQVEGKRAIHSYWIVLVFCILTIIGLFIAFCWRQVVWWKWDLPIDNGLLGTLGDFIGGVLGTLIALYSILMLVKTLQKQIASNADTRITNDSVIKTNHSVIESNKKSIELGVLQLFDNKFQVFFNQYKDAIASYENGERVGRQALEEKVSLFVEQPFVSNLVYKKRVISAVRVFEEFYAENRRMCSVHFRGLYLLIRLVAEANIIERDRVWYAKCIRGQLSEGELVILRYNCLTSNGMAMRRFVNHFNLLKHLSLMSLFEFRKWADMIPDKHERSALDASFIMLKKIMKEENSRKKTVFNENNSKNSDSSIESTLVEISSRYLITITYCNDHKCMIFRLEENKQHKRGSGVKRPSIEKALDKIGTKELPELFYSFLHESFLTGNFGLYGNPPNCIYSPIIVEDSKLSFIFEIEVKGPKRLVLSEDQLFQA